MSRATEVSLISLGLVLALFGGALLWRVTGVHPIERTPVLIAAGVLGTGLLLIAPTAIAAGIKGVGSAAADAWRASKDAGKDTPGGTP